jgi:flagellar biosynthesis/type III secretory pathway protein FliH
MRAIRYMVAAEASDPAIRSSLMLLHAMSDRDLARCITSERLARDAKRWSEAEWIKEGRVQGREEGKKKEREDGRKGTSEARNRLANDIDELTELLNSLK